MNTRRQQIIEVIRERGLLRLPEPVVLASGELSRDFIVGDVEFDAVGGLTMGADQFAHVIAVLAGVQWFVVRKEPKGRGTNKLVEGAKVGEGWKVLLVDDVVTTGGSIQKAHDAIVGLGAIVVAAATLVDRGEVAAQYFREREIPYAPVVTYRDLGIEPVGGGLVRT